MKNGNKVIHSQIGVGVIVGVGVGLKSDTVVVDFGENLKDWNGNTANTWLECKKEKLILKEEQ